MAQTRTAGKALRSLFAHIAVLAGYSATPAEEMDGVQVNERTDPKPATPAERADEATGKQKQALFAKANAKFNDREKALAFINWCKGAEAYWTKKMASNLIDEFEDQIEIYEQQLHDTQAA